MLCNRVYIKLCTVCFVASIASLMPMSTVWAQECTTEALNQRFPSAVSAVSRWSQQYKVAIGTEAQNLVLHDFCQAANGIQMKKGVDNAVIDAAAPDVVFEYLNSVNDSSSSSVLSVGALLRSALGSSGFSPQKIKPLAILELKHGQFRIDHLEINGIQIPPRERILHVPGRYVVRGIQGKSVVCSKQIELTVNQKTVDTCEPLHVNISQEDSR